MLDGQIKDIAPRGYTDFDSFCDAFVSRRLSQHEQVSPYDDYATAKAKNRHLHLDREYAIEDAREKWEAHLDYMTECYERGIGPAWD